MRKFSKVAADWWDYTTLDDEILDEAAKIELKDLPGLQRPGFEIRLYENRDEFFLAEALEYIKAFTASSSTRPTGICGPIGPTEQLPLVASIINDLEIDVRDGHFWGMDEWILDGKEVSADHPLSFAKADLELCFNRIDSKLRMPDDHLHFPSVSGLSAFSALFDEVECFTVQGGQGEVKHWAFNDPPERSGQYRDAPPPAEEYMKQGARIVDLHPMTIIQNARTSGGGRVSTVPTQALTIGPQETMKAGAVSIWHPGWHDNPFGMRLSTLMLSKKIIDTSVPMSLMGLHDQVVFHFLTPSFGTCAAEMH